MPKNIDDRYRLAFEFANAGMFIVSVNGEIQEANARACEIFGMEPGALDGAGVNDLAIPDDHGVSPNAIGRLLAGQSDRETFEKRYRHRDGWIVHGLVSIALVRDKSGAPSYFISQLQDISDRKQAELDLRESEKRLNFALAASGLGCWDWDIPGEKVFLDQASLAMIGYQAGEFIPDKSAWGRLFHPDDKSKVCAAIKAHMDGDTAAYEMEHRFRHKDGHWLWMLGRGKIIARDADGKPLRMTGTHENITHRRRIESESANLLGQIEQLMREALRRPAIDQLAKRPESPRKTDRLTRRQLEVLRLVATGLTSAEIATRLHIATETVEGHRRDLMRKLDVRSVAGLTKLAIEDGLLVN